MASASFPISHGPWASVWPVSLRISWSDYLPSMVVFICSRHSTLVSMAWDSWRLVLLVETKVKEGLSTFLCVLRLWGPFLIEQWRYTSSVFLLMDLRSSSWHPDMSVWIPFQVGFDFPDCIFACSGSIPASFLQHLSLIPPFAYLLFLIVSDFLGSPGFSSFPWLPVCWDELSLRL